MSDYYDNSYPMDANSGRNYGFHLNEPNVNHNYQSMPMYAMNEHSMDTNYSYPIAPNRAYNYRPSYSHNQSDYDYYERSYSPLSVKSYHGSSHWTPYATAGQFSYYETQRLYASQYTTHPYPPYPPTGAPPAAQMPPQSYGWIPTTVEEFELKPSQSLSSQSSFDEEIVSVANEPIDRKPTVAELQRFSAMNANRMTTPVIISANQAMSLLAHRLIGANNNRCCHAVGVHCAESLEFSHRWLPIDGLIGHRNDLLVKARLRRQTLTRLQLKLLDSGWDPSVRLGRHLGGRWGAGWRVWRIRVCRIL
ncbi:unnamed protein product [Oppiella nova]|uniref:Uncharacterized protein n=1 Tax=Oppiella nova TaxID=334625 RepID=A0A7R9QSB5_9ACAR|nr:unnamed protein product [Oppiella nova]CAG2173198.1 unnamed protein product [Oppiella nova]